MTDLSSDLVAAYRSTMDREDSLYSLGAVHYRGGRTEWELGCQYALSADPLDRITGADVLAQLGWWDRTFLQESVGVLLGLLSDPDAGVVAAAAIGLGHRNDPSAISPVLKLVGHPDSHVRFGVVLALSRHDDPAAIDGLIRLSRDEADRVRNWAAFGLGSQTEMDTPPLREALALLLSDPDPEIRGEALIGLARRQDERACTAVFRELEGDFHGSWCLEAAELLRNPALLSGVQSLYSRISEEDRVAFSRDFDGAALACRSNSGT